MFKLVIFDMDGLLIDSEPYWRTAQQLAFNTVDVTLTENEMQHTMGRRVDEVVAYWFHERRWKGATQKDIEALIVDKLIELVRQEGKPKRGVLATLENLKSLKIPMAIASSSSSEVIHNVVDSLKIRDYFSLLHSAEHESHGKPHPGVFITAAEKMNVEQHRCLVFEDSPTGVLAAKAAKMSCIAIPDDSSRMHPYVRTADKILNSLEEFDILMLDELSK